MSVTDFDLSGSLKVKFNDTDLLSIYDFILIVAMCLSCMECSYQKCLKLVLQIHFETVCQYMFPLSEEISNQEGCWDSRKTPPNNKFSDMTSRVCKLKKALVQFLGQNSRFM